VLFIRDVQVCELAIERSWVTARCSRVLLRLFAMPLSVQRWWCFESGRIASLAAFCRFTGLQCWVVIQVDRSDWYTQEEGRQSISTCAERILLVGENEMELRVLGWASSSARCIGDFGCSMLTLFVSWATNTWHPKTPEPMCVCTALVLRIISF